MLRQTDATSCSSLPLAAIIVTISKCHTQEANRVNFKRHFIVIVTVSRWRERWVTVQSLSKVKLCLELNAGL